MRNLVFHFSIGLAHSGTSSTQNPCFTWTQFHFTTSDCKFPNFLDKCIQIYFGEKKKTTTHDKALLDNIHLQLFFHFPVLDHLLSHVNILCQLWNCGAGKPKFESIKKTPKPPKTYTSSRSWSIRTKAGKQTNKAQHTHTPKKSHPRAALAHDAVAISLKFLTLLFCSFGTNCASII